ncbi:hypothetical protein FRC03_010073 [Tulasnella sp. 419]|nr:hypothetical protein FRC03_010073 [Tulasnella sp. 419]
MAHRRLQINLLGLISFLYKVTALKHLRLAVQMDPMTIYHDKQILTSLETWSSLGQLSVIQKRSRGCSQNMFLRFPDCHKSGLYCGAYHVAHPTKCTGDDQAKYFVRHGGDWDKNKKKLPGALSIGCEDEPKDCFGLSASQLVDWICDFSKTYHSKTDRYPVISTTAKWWKHCTNNSREFKGKNPLWLVGDDETPGHWDHWSFLEYKSPEHDKPGKMKWYSNYDALKSFSNKHD